MACKAVRFMVSVSAACLLLARLSHSSFFLCNMVSRTLYINTTQTVTATWEDTGKNYEDRCIAYRFQCEGGRFYFTVEELYSEGGKCEKAALVVKYDGLIVPLCNNGKNTYNITTQGSSLVVHDRPITSYDFETGRYQFSVSCVEFETTTTTTAPTTTSAADIDSIILPPVATIALPPPTAIATATGQ